MAVSFAEYDNADVHFPKLIFDRMVQSDIFTFHIGAGEEMVERKTYSEAIAATSDKMRALVTGGMRESDTRSAQLKDVLAEDFDRFYEYALRGDYTVPAWQLDKEIKEEANLDLSSMEPEATDAESAAADAQQQDLDAWTWGPSIPKKKKGKREKEKSLLQGVFDRRTFIAETDPKKTIAFGFDPQPNSESNQDFRPIFLAHARLYTFADMHFVDPLKRLVLHKLHKTLTTFQLFYTRIGDIIELARYAYDHNLDRKENGAVDELRKLVVEYIAREIDIIGRSKEFESLIEEGGEFVVDFWRIAQAYKVLA